jgi:deazaflavin-dependent oxidoreductase (nitroreductase family)
MSTPDFNQQVITEFHENAGVVGGMFDGMPILLLHHVGAKSGAARIAPLVYLPDGDRYVVFASKGGAPEHPSWFHNLNAHPQTKVEVGTEVVEVVASEATEDERARLYTAQVEVSPQFGEYQSKTTRQIPVVVLTPTG